MHQPLTSQRSFLFQTPLVQHNELQVLLLLADFPCLAGPWQGSSKAALVASSAGGWISRIFLGRGPPYSDTVYHGADRCGSGGCHQGIYRVSKSGRLALFRQLCATVGAAWWATGHVGAIWHSTVLTS